MDAETSRQAETLRALERALVRTEHDKVLALSSQLLEGPVTQPSSSDRSEEAALLRARLFQVRGTARANLGQTEAAVADLEQVPEVFRDESLRFLLAYLYYQIRNLSAAKQHIPQETAEGAEFPSTSRRSWDLLRAQVAYVEGKLDQAANTWLRLLSSSVDHAETGALWTNWFAAQSSKSAPVDLSGDASQGLGVLRDAQLYEGLFNVALWCSLRGDADTATDLLEDARRVAVSELGTEQHVDVARIDVQRGCLLQHQGQELAAQAVYAQLATWQAPRAIVPVDGTTDWVRAFNLSVIEGCLDALLDSEPSTWTVTDAQRQILYWDRALVAIQRKQPHIALDAAEAAFMHRNDAAMLKACALDSLGRHEDAEQLLLAHHLVMPAAQLRYQRGDLTGALALLEQLPILDSPTNSGTVLGRNQPANVLFRVSVYRRQGQLQRALEALQEIDHRKLSIRRLYVEILLENKQYNDALDYLAKDAISDCVLESYRLIALSYIDPLAAEQVLPKHIEERIAREASLRSHQGGWRAPTSESTFGTLRSNQQGPYDTEPAAARAASARPSDAGNAETVASRRRRGHRKSRNPLPQSFRADAPPPDPSRWLPRHLRPGSRRKARRQAGAPGSATTDRATQGKIETATELDAQIRAASAAAKVLPMKGAATKLAGKRRVRPSRAGRS